MSAVASVVPRIEEQRGGLEQLLYSKHYNRHFVLKKIFKVLNFGKKK